MLALMRENFQRAVPPEKKFHTACNSSCGKFSANIFSLYGHIRVKTLEIYSSVLTFGKFIGPFLVSDCAAKRRLGATRKLAHGRR